MILTSKPMDQVKPYCLKLDKSTMVVVKTQRRFSPFFLFPSLSISFFSLSLSLSLSLFSIISPSRLLWAGLEDHMWGRKRERKRRKKNGGVDLRHFFEFQTHVAMVIFNPLLVLRRGGGRVSGRFKKVESYGKVNIHIPLFLLLFDSPSLILQCSAVVVQSIQKKKGGVFYMRVNLSPPPPLSSYSLH